MTIVIELTWMQPAEDVARHIDYPRMLRPRLDLRANRDDSLAVSCDAYDVVESRRPDLANLHSLSVEPQQLPERRRAPDCIRQDSV